MSGDDTAGVDVDYNIITTAGPRNYTIVRARYHQHRRRHIIIIIIIIVEMLYLFLLFIPTRVEHGRSLCRITTETVRRRQNSKS
jgi:hypothetical protein